MCTTVHRFVLLYTVLILLYVCSHTTKCIAVEGATPTAMYVASYYYVSPRTTICVFILLHASAYYYRCLLNTTIYVLTYQWHVRGRWLATLI